MIYTQYVCTKKALFATKVTVNVNYYSFTSFCFQENFAQICMHVIITLPENLVIICQAGFTFIYNEKSENRCNILKLAQTIRAKSRWTASPSFIHPFTALTLIFWRFSAGIVTPNSCIQMLFSLPTPVSMLRSIVESVQVPHESTLKMGSGENHW